MAAKPPIETKKKRIGELLIDADIITMEQLNQALAVQKKDGGKVVEILINLGHLDTGKVAQFLASQPGIPSIDISNYRVQNDVLSLIPREFALQHEIFPIDKLGKLLTVGMAFPLDAATIKKLEDMTGLRVKALLCSPEDIRNAIEQYYKRPTAAAAETEHDAEAARISAGACIDGIAHLISKIDSLPTLPQTVQQVQELAQSAETPLKDIAAIIAQDPAISGKLLRLANSPAFGFTRKVDNVELATSLLGLRETCMAVTSSAIINLTENATRFDHAAFWRQSLLCADLARSIGNLCGLKKNTGIFTAGLLCDIGQFALSECAPARYAKIPATLRDRELVAAEEEALGLGHPEAGHILAEHWALPREIAEPIRFHVTPEHAETCPEITAIVSLAARLVEAHTRNEQDELELLRGCDAALTRLNLAADKLIKLYKELGAKK
jgi:HD-like signal output (HDOD) protein